MHGDSLISIEAGDKGTVAVEAIDLLAKEGKSLSTLILGVPS